MALLHRVVGDMRDQSPRHDNLEAVLAQAGLGLANVVRLNYYMTDVDAFVGIADVLVERLAKAGCVTSSTLLGVRTCRPVHPGGGLVCRGLHMPGPPEAVAQAMRSTRETGGAPANS